MNTTNQVTLEQIEDQERLVSCYWDDYCDTRDPGYRCEYERQLKKLELMKNSVNLDKLVTN